MQLTKLELHGFKSFADPTEMLFNAGVTAVVGPNGCGKSNVSDAVRWVLGEQRARMLRGAKMEEVIFQGSSARKAVNLAEVSLHFSNDDGGLPVPFQEVVITRRLSRAGESEYFLNRVPCRLRDIHDLVRGTGLGADSGVVIESRMIDALLSDRPDDRRELFEEAAGVGLYRDRRRSTERSLEQTTADLSRLDDLVNEVTSQVRSLARQRKRAERHGEITTRRFAPEHLSIPDTSLLPGIRHAGSVFVGPYSPEAGGDYASGPNHVLPTGGAARIRGGLSVTDFLKVISVQELSAAALARLAPVIATLARAEGLEAHARSVEVRAK